MALCKQSGIARTLNVPWPLDSFSGWRMLAEPLIGIVHYGYSVAVTERAAGR